MKFIKETDGILTSPGDVRTKALTLDYYTNENHPEIADGGEEWVVNITKDISKETGVLANATIEIINQLQKDTNKLVTEYKSYCQYTTASSKPGYIHTDQYLLLKNEFDFKVDYIANVYLTPDDVQEESSWYEFFEAKYIDDKPFEPLLGDEMPAHLKLTSDKVTDVGTRIFEYNKCLAYESNFPHKAVPMSNSLWGTDVSDSPLIFTVYMRTSY